MKRSLHAQRACCLYRRILRCAWLSKLTMPVQSVLRPPDQATSGSSKKQLPWSAAAPACPSTPCMHACQLLREGWEITYTAVTTANDLPRAREARCPDGVRVAVL